MWQVIPVKPGEFMVDKDREKAERVMTVMLQMKKMDLAALERAYEGSWTWILNLLFAQIISVLESMISFNR